MTAKGETRPAVEKMALGQSLYLQAINCLNNHPGGNSKVSGYLGRSEEIKQAAQALDLLGGGKLPSLSSLHFGLSRGRRRLIGRKEVRFQVEAKLSNETIIILTLTVTPDGDCQHKITQKGSFVVGPYGITEKTETGTIKPKERTTAEKIGACQILLTGIKSQVAQSNN
jgi:hypothetical protein